MTKAQLIKHIKNELKEFESAIKEVEFNGRSAAQYTYGRIVLQNILSLIVTME